MGVPPQQQVNTRGQRLDDHRNMPRSYAWPGKPTTFTYTISVWAAGTYTFDIDGITIQSTTSTDAPTAILELEADFNSKTSALKLAFVSPSAGVLTTQARSVDAAFVVDNNTQPGGATVAIADTTNPLGRLPVGVAVAQDETNPEAVRELRAGDTAASVIGVTTENEHLALSDGDPDAIDGWDPGTSVSITDEGLIPVAVEGDSGLIAVGDPVYYQIQSPAGEEIGAVRDTADGANTTPAAATNIRYNGNGYDDLQGRATVEVMLRMP